MIGTGILKYNFCVVVLLCFNNFTLCPLSSSKNNPKHQWFFSIQLHRVVEPFEEHMKSPSCCIKNNMIPNMVFFPFPALDGTTGQSILPRYMYISTSLNIQLIRRGHELPYPTTECMTQTGKEIKKDTLWAFKRPKWPIRSNKRLHLKWCLIFENNKSK